MGWGSSRGHAYTLCWRGASSRKRCSAAVGPCACRSALGGASGAPRCSSTAALSGGLVPPRPSARARCSGAAPCASGALSANGVHEALPVVPLYAVRMVRPRLTREPRTYCAPPPGQAALRLRYVQRAGGWYAWPIRTVVRPRGVRASTRRRRATLRGSSPAPTRPPRGARSLPPHRPPRPSCRAQAATQPRATRPPPPRPPRRPAAGQMSSGSAAPPPPAASCPRRRAPRPRRSGLHSLAA